MAVPRNDDPSKLQSSVVDLWLNHRCAYIEIKIISPVLEDIPEMIIPAKVDAESEEEEFVYPIHDTGHTLLASKGSEMFEAGMSMCKLYYTIEKMIALLMERLNNAGIPAEQEVELCFAGSVSAQRKAFESIINLNQNISVQNFEPGPFGDRLVQILQRFAARGIPLPLPAPRDVFKVKPDRNSSELTHP